MNKDFKKWHIQKSNIHNEKIRPHFHEREVWFTSVGANIGFEQDGKGEQYLRPIVIIKKFNNESLWGISLTTKNKSGIYYFRFEHENNHTSTANLSQLRLIDSKRLEYQIGSILEKDFNELKKRIITIIK